MVIELCTFQKYSRHLDSKIATLPQYSPINIPHNKEEIGVPKDKLWFARILKSIFNISFYITIGS